MSLSASTSRFEFPTILALGMMAASYGITFMSNGFPREKALLPLYILTKLTRSASWSTCVMIPWGKGVVQGPGSATNIHDIVSHHRHFFVAAAVQPETTG
jgi:hypothetical protein